MKRYLTSAAGILTGAALMMAAPPTMAGGVDVGERQLRARQWQEERGHDNREHDDRRCPG